MTLTTILYIAVAVYFAVLAAMGGLFVWASYHVYRVVIRKGTSKVTPWWELK